MARTTLSDIDRNSCILVTAKKNPKRPWTIARRYWNLYGRYQTPQVTVEEFLSSWPVEMGGRERARRALLWDLEHETIRLVPNTVGQLLAA